MLLAAIIWKLSDTPGLTVAHGALDTLLRKLAHVFAFGLLASTCVVAVRAQGVRRSAALVSAAAIALVYAIVDATTTGLGAIVDADIGKASAAVQAQQVRQQLGIQSLSIANQQPSVLLGLFR